MKNPKTRINFNTYKAIAFCSLFLLSSQISFANEDDNPFGLGEDGTGGFSDPFDNPIDTPYFWALLFLLGVYIAYKKLQPKTT